MGYDRPLGRPLRDLHGRGGKPATAAATAAVVAATAAAAAAVVAVAVSTAAASALAASFATAVAVAACAACLPAATAATAVGPAAAVGLAVATAERLAVAAATTAERLAVAAAERLALAATTTAERLAVATAGLGEPTRSFLRRDLNVLHVGFYCFARPPMQRADGAVLWWRLCRRSVVLVEFLATRPDRGRREGAPKGPASLPQLAAIFRHIASL